MKHLILQNLGLLGSLLFTSAYIPQIIHLLKVKDSKGISIPSWLIRQVGAVILLTYAIYIGDIVFIVLTGLETTFLAIVIILAVKYKK